MLHIPEIPIYNSIQLQRTWLLIHQLQKGKQQSSVGLTSGNSLFKNETQTLVW